MIVQRNNWKHRHYFRKVLIRFPTNLYSCTILMLLLIDCMKIAIKHNSNHFLKSHRLKMSDDFMTTALHDHLTTVAKCLFMIFTILFVCIACRNVCAKVQFRTFAHVQKNMCNALVVVAENSCTLTVCVHITLFSMYSVTCHLLVVFPADFLKNVI